MCAYRWEARSTTPGDWAWKPAALAMIQAAQLATDVAAVTAAKADVLDTRTILGVLGTLDMDRYVLIAGVEPGSNRMNAGLDALVTTLRAALVPAVLKGVSTQTLLQATVHDAPALGLEFSAADRQGGPPDTPHWVGTVLATLVASAERTAAKQVTTDLLAELETALKAHNDSGVAGGFWDMLKFLVWADNDGDRVKCGAVGTLRFQTDGMLKT